ncbi:universal stress protein [Microtetraspora glauca]|uniref:Universal stress protein n=1 Tax=Microtetraspora glauca TaxID=1996 RepID=A0ABV3GGX3_MICGL
MAAPIVVGTDGSPSASVALEWAADDAARKGLPLRVVHVVHHLPYVGATHVVPGLEDALTRAGRRILDEAERIAWRGRPDIEVSVALLDGSPEHVLVAEAAQASELVVGSRGRGGFAGMLLGSVSSYVAGRVAVPVVVVRPDHTPARVEVVVGIDESGECDSALGYAFEQARLLDCPLRAVHGWQLASEISSGWFIHDLEDVKRMRERLARGALAAWRAAYPGVPVEVEVVHEHPVTALVRASRDAVMLVVGSHGRGPLGSAVLGSVSRGVLHHARCPVAVVRPPAAGPTAPT